MDDKSATTFSLVDSGEQQEDTDTNGILADTERTKRTENSDMLVRYLRLLDEHPLATKSATSAIIGALGGIIAGTTSSLSESNQKGRLKKRAGGIEWLDVLVYAMYGAVQGPMSHFW